MLAGTIDGQVDAAAAARLSPVHPTRHWGFIEVRDDERSNGIGTTMLRELLATLSHFETDHSVIVAEQA